MRNKEMIYYILLFFCILWLIVSTVFWQYYVALYYLNLVINPIGVLILSFAIINNKYHKLFKLLVSCYFFTYGFVFIFYDISYYIKAYSKIDNFYIFSDMSMILTPFKIYSDQIKKRIGRKN
jgi:hypothetical protein